MFDFKGIIFLLLQFAYVTPVHCFSIIVALKLKAPLRLIPHVPYISLLFSLFFLIFNGFKFKLLNCESHCKGVENTLFEYILNFILVQYIVCKFIRISVQYICNHIK